jgi:hypothetical protein
MKFYVKTCDFCHNSFLTKRSHTVFCDGYCRTFSCRIAKDFERWTILMSEDNLNKYFDIVGYEEHTYYIKWFRIKLSDGTYQRSADVYVAKENTPDLHARLVRKKAVISFSSFTKDSLPVLKH